MNGFRVSRIGLWGRFSVSGTWGAEGALQFTPYTLPLIIAALIALVLCVFMLRYRNVPGRMTFVLLMAGVAVWAGGYALEISAIDPQVKVFWAKAQYFGIAVVPLLWLRFVVHFVGESAWLTPLRFSLLAVGPALTVSFVMLNRTFVGPAAVEAPGLQLFWRQITLDESRALRLFRVRVRKTAGTRS